MSDFISDDDMAKMDSQGKSSGGFITDQDMSKMTAPDPEENPLVSGVRQFAQGASGNFSDELAGLVEGAGKAVGVNGAGGPMKDISLSDEGPTVDWNILKDAYMRARDKERASLAKDKKDNPTVSALANLGGAIASPINKLAAGMSLPAAGATLGAVTGLGGSDKEDLGGVASDTALSAGLGGILGKGIEAASPLIQKGVNAAGNKLSGIAEHLAENATGATGRQAEKFAPDAGRQLLDRGLIKFGDNAGNIAERTGAAMDSANGAIDSALKALDAKGVTVSQDNVVKELESQIENLSKDPSQSGMVRKLKGIVDDITQTGESNIPIGQAEQIKRGFNKAAGNWMDPEAGQAGKQAYRAYMGNVEDAANAADPSLAAKFAEGKKTYGLLAPIEEAASRRASTVNQSPIGGLGDMAAAGAGAVTGGVVGAPLGVAAKKFLAPRLASAGAVTSDKVSKLLMNSPSLAALAQKSPQAFASLAQKMSSSIAPENKSKEQAQKFEPDAIVQKAQGTKYASVLQNAAQRGPEAVRAANFVLQGRDPEYRKMTIEDEDRQKDLQGDDEGGS